MKLINTIEISPFDYSQEDYQSPNGSISEFPEEWNQYWLQCISDKNLGNLAAISKGSWLVDIETINADELEAIIAKKLGDIDLDDFEEQLGKFSGGIAVLENDMVLIEPTCCGDIGSNKEWDRIFDTNPETWTQLWIGHPWIYFKRSHSDVAFSDYTESSLEELPEIKAIYTFYETDLKNELKEIAVRLKDFEAKICSTLHRMGIQNAERMAKLMTGNI